MSNMFAKIKNSNFSFSKKFLYFLIAPAVILLVGFILLLTVGFNSGIDYKSGTTFTVYTNYDSVIESAHSYDLNNADDYNEVYNKIAGVLDEHNAKIVSYRVTSMDILDYPVVNGQAVEVVYQNSNVSSSAMRDEIIEIFDYQSAQNAVSTFDQTTTEFSFEFVYSLVACIVFAIISAMIYLGARCGFSSMLAVLLQVAFDLFVTIGLLLITRVTINSTIGVILLATTILSICNIMYMYLKMKYAKKLGQYEKMTPSQIADNFTKETFAKKIVIFVVLFVTMLVMSIVAVAGVRDVMLAIMLAVIVTSYSSILILPNIWATLSSVRKKKTIKQ